MKLDSVNTTGATPLSVNKLSQLNRGLLMLNIQKEMEEPGYTAMDRISKNRKVVSRRQEYCSDLERVIDEAKFTTHLLSEVQNQTKVSKKIYEPEEIISYYNGIFLDQVHQLKDKLFRMIALLLLVPETAQDNQKKDPKEIKYQPFMNKNESLLKKIEIYDLLSQWGKNNLAVALKKRTNHHHFVSTLRLNNDFQKIKMSKMMLDPTKPMLLSEYGRKRISEIGEESFKKWREEIVTKQQTTIDEIEKNIEQVAEKLIIYFKIPTTPQELALIANKYTEFLSSMDINNQANITKISPTIKEIVDEFVKFCKKEINKKLVSVYLVGSSGRGEFIPGSSDINLYVITNTGKFGSYSNDSVKPMNVIFLSKEEFLSKSYKKDRFICWSDGILLCGEEIKFDKKEFPKPGTLLCLLLNRGFIEKLEKIKGDVKALNNSDAKTLRPYCLKAIKIVMDFDFGVAMANKPFYTASRDGKLKYTKEAWPNERRTITLEQLYKGSATIRKEDFPILIDNFLGNAKINYKKLLDIEAEINKDSLT